jgi:hypothetical protein
MVLLLIVTAGIYYPSWFLLRRDGINSLNANEKLGTLPFIVGIVLFVVIFVLDIISTTTASESADVGSRIVQFAAGILLLIQCFKVRRILEAHLQETLSELSDHPHLRHSQSALSGWPYSFCRFSICSTSSTIDWRQSQKCNALRLGVGQSHA